MDRLDAIRRVVALVESLGRHCCLVGGLAVSARARERFTKDIDFAVAVANDAQAEAVALGFQRAGYPLMQVLEQTERAVLSTLRFAVPGSGSAAPGIDLLFGSCGIEAEIVARAEQVAFRPGVEIPVARLPHLIAMKVLSESAIRANDHADLHALIAAATKAELAEAEAAVRLIAARGFDRGKDLVAILAGFVAQRSSSRPS